MEKTFLTGFARADITPPLGIAISGYYQERYAEGVLDNLEVNTAAFSDGENTAVIASVDNLHLNAEFCDPVRAAIAKRCGISEDAVFIACTHTHTGPQTGIDFATGKPACELYDQMLSVRIEDSAVAAVADLEPTKVYTGRAQAPKISFVRRFRMKTGEVRTNPGVGNPNIDHPIGDVDETVQLVRFVREGGKDIALVNFPVHPDTIGGCKISADYPGFVRSTVEKALDDVNCIFLNGAQGDVNHVNVNAKNGDLNGLETDTFDDVARGYEHSRHMGRVIAGAVLQIWDKLDETDPGNVIFGRKVIQLPSSRVGADKVREAEKIIEIHMRGEDHLLPWEGMELTTAVAEATRMKRLENGPDYFDLPLTAVGFGNIIYLGIPGEPFTAIGKGIKAGSPFEFTCPCCLTNGSIGYFPTMDAYVEGGYEARTSNFAAGVAENIIEGAVALLKELK
ncbi:MAG: neutral/alkaline non-lysosomal ceramidase N-terminal domain-containing protein [Oscillospiraceae bacterium]|nr:neutral/alkaline non-lysosomal ceramidase N-terminal domain-containing protein [Oscillospiraceae bacterium]